MKELKDYTDLELAEIQGQIFQELMRVQANIQAVAEEIRKRRPTLPIPPTPQLKEKK